MSTLKQRCARRLKAKQMLTQCEGLRQRAGPEPGIHQDHRVVNTSWPHDVAPKESFTNLLLVVFLRAR